ncbi:hypothetical protein C8J56DRAFT_1139730 [Mycena floridula]|nr:hypothetical protein C8J56DRAFT_1139730 [Mycena floridula]
MAGPTYLGNGVTALGPSNQSGELLAVKAAIEEAMEHRHLTIISDSKFAIEGLTKHLELWEDQGFIGSNHAKLFQVSAARLRERKTKTSFKWVKGHAGTEGNEEADRLAGLGALLEQTEEVKMDIDPKLRLTGAKLSALTQSLAYKAIRKKKLENKSKTFLKQIERRPTIRNVETTRFAAQELSNGHLPTDKKIWKAVNHADMTLPTRYFFWMTMHDAYKVGEYWTRMDDPDFRERGICELCFVLEDMEHILTRCKAPGQAEVWDLAKSLWKKKKGTRWRKPKMGTILACPMAELVSSRGKKRPGASRLFRILISEAAHLIWKLRNERTIPDEEGRTQPAASVKEIENRFTSAMNARLAKDRALTNRLRYGKRALSKSSVLSTWNGVLERNTDLPPDWTEEDGVLVGKTCISDPEVVWRRWRRERDGVG